MDRDILRQYTDLQQEIRDLRSRIGKKEKQILQMEEGCIVSDTVKGTRKDGTIGTITVKGFPEPEYYYRKSSLEKSCLRMKQKELKLLELTCEVEKFIDEIPDSRTRRIFRYRYLDNLSWIQVAHYIGGKATEENCRAIHNRYLGIKK